LQRLEDLAYDINDFIKSQQQAAKDCPQHCVYLAETTPELNDARNEIKRTLQQHSYCVLPDENLPFESHSFEEKVSAYLRRCDLSIHLIGSDHTNINADDEKVLSRLRLHHEMAAERIRKQHEQAMSRAERDPNYSRLIWMPANLRAQESSYQDFIDYLRNDPAVYENAEILCGSNLEDLKTTVQRKLKLNRQANPSSDKRKRVYLVCDKQDLTAAAPIQSLLAEQKYEVMLPFREGSQVVTSHNENLRLCDAALLFYGEANTIEYKLKDLRRIDVFRENRPLLAKGIYVAGPETDQKQAFATNEAVVMKNFGDFSPESIRPFLEQFENVFKGAEV
jgi:hypothetical protein